MQQDQKNLQAMELPTLLVTLLKTSRFDLNLDYQKYHDQYEYFFLSASICEVCTGSIQLIMCCVVVELSYELYIVC